MIWRSTIGRFAALVFGLQVVTVSVLLVGLGVVLRDQSARQVQATAETIRDDLLATRAQGGEGALRRAIDLRTARAAGDDAVVLLVDPAGRRIAGNLIAWPAGLVAGAGYATLDVTRRGLAEPEAVRARATVLPDGGRLLTGVRVEGQRQLLALVERGSLIALVLGLAMAALAAWLAARMIVARLQTTIATLDAVQAGDLARRVPADATGDAFARLGADVNRTLDRVSALVQELQLATDSLAHDLKSPLTRMRVALEQAMAEARSPATQDALDRALAESERLMAIVQTALSISRAEAGIGRDGFVPTDLGEMLETVAEIYAPLAEEQGRPILATAPPGIVLPVHRQLLGQAIGNLVDNAMRYGAGEIALGLSTGAGGIAVTVADRGPGIPAERRADALRRFVRLDAARGGSGAGLGLALVQAVAHLHGGEVTLSDAAPGLVVTLTLRPPDGAGGAA